MKLAQLNNKIHSRDSFTCGEPLLDNYLKKQVSQDVKRNLTTCTVLIDSSNVIKGYYTLSCSSVEKDSLPPKIANQLPPSYTYLPYVLLGRLAVDNSLKGQGFGEILLLDALYKCVKVSEQLGILGIVVDPINDGAETFYSKYGFITLPTSKRMVISIQTIKKLIDTIS